MINEFTNYLKTDANLSSKSLKSYCMDVKQYLNNCQDYLNPDIYEYVNYLTNTLKLKDSSVRRKIISVRKFYDYLVLKGIIEKSPFEGLELKIKQEKNPTPKVLTINEIKQLLDCFNIDRSTLSGFQKSQFIRDAALIDLLISTGIKVEEASNILLTDIFPQEKSIFIRSKVCKERYVYITSLTTWNRLVELIDIQKSIGTNYLFTNRYNQQISTQSIEKIYTKYVKKTQINIKSSPNDLRHTFASNLMLNGADLQTVRQILGFSDTSSSILKYVKKDTCQRLNKY